MLMASMLSAVSVGRAPTLAFIALLQVATSLMSQRFLIIGTKSARWGNRAAGQTASTRSAAFVGSIRSQAYLAQKR